MPKTTTKEDKKAATKVEGGEKKKRVKKEAKDPNKPKRSVIQPGYISEIELMGW
jgi:hypothetical protein